MRIRQKFYKKKFKPCHLNADKIHAEMQFMKDLRGSFNHVEIKVEDTDDKSLDDANIYTSPWDLIK